MRMIWIGVLVAFAGLAKDAKIVPAEFWLEQDIIELKIRVLQREASLTAIQYRDAINALAGQKATKRTEIYDKATLKPEEYEMNEETHSFKKIEKK